jgi:prepilin-type N-terminal cleavage/methylation domain-containing protein/prepilin-type processing-associated H-X9-DG protein
MRKIKAFTLVELLVVISIIALLLSVLMPALSKARDQAQQLMCLSNLKQWGMMFSMYVNENNGRSYGGHDWGTKQTWMAVLRKYYSNVDKIRCCPKATKTTYVLNKSGLQAKGPGYSEDNRFQAWGVFGYTAWMEKGDYGSYAENSWITNPPTKQEVPTSDADDWQPQRYWRTLNVRDGSLIPVFGDSRWCGVWPDPYHLTTLPKTATDMSYTAVAYYAVDRHRSRVNWVFLDGHSQKIDLKELWSMKWYKGWEGDRARVGTNFTWPAWMK